jgi:putative ABC transport system permease protein
VTDVGGLGIVQLGARVPGNGPRDLADVALFGVELLPRGIDAAPADGEVWADRVLEADGIRVGTELLLGPARSPVTVVGFVEDTNYLGQGGLWGSPATWRAVVGANRPAEVVADGVFQSLVVRGTGDPADLAAAIDTATGGATLSLALVDTANAIPGVAEQRSTFNQIIGVTVAIAIVVIALFFALLTVERLALYGVLKAIGARSRTIFAGLVVQAVVVTAVASVAATAVVLLLDAAIPPGSIPVTITLPRIVSSIVSLLVAAIAGSAFSLRRVLRVDPASAIGSSS